MSIIHHNQNFKLELVINLEKITGILVFRATAIKTRIRL